MNKCYTKVWNAALGQVVVASELASGDTVGSAATPPRASVFSMNILALALMTGLYVVAAPSAVAADIICKDAAGNVIATTTTSGSGSEIACGEGATTTTGGAIAIGTGAKATKADATAIGTKSNATGAYSIATGSEATALGTASIMIGQKSGQATVTTKSFDPSITTQNIGIGVGAANNVVGANNAAIGSNTGVYLAGSGNTSFGNNAGARVFGSANVAIGDSAGRDIGTNTGATPDTASAGLIQGNSNNVAVGANSGSYVSGQSNIALGYNAGKGTSAKFLQANNTISAGANSLASADNAIAVGTNTTALLTSGVAIGTSSQAAGDSAIAIGAKAKTVSTGAAIAVGYQSQAYAVDNGSGAIAVGVSSQALDSAADIAIGNKALAENNKNGSGSTIAIGNGAKAKSGVGIGESVVSTTQSTVVGNEARATGGQANVFGFRAVGGDQGTAIGNNSLASATQSVALGSEAKATGTQSTALGTKAAASKLYDLAVGYQSTATGGQSIAMGWTANASNANAISIGTKAAASGLESLAIGTGAVASGKQSISIGTGNRVTGDQSGAIGDPSIIDAAESYSVGNNNAIATGQNNVFVLGNNVTKTASFAVALGSNTAVNIASGVALGAYSQANIGPGAIGFAPLAATTKDIAAINATNSALYGAVSVGSGAAGGNRQIVNVAAGTNDSDAVNVSQLKAVANAAAAGQTHYYSVNDGGVQQGNYNNDGAKASGALAAGTNATALSTNSIAVGNNATAGKLDGTYAGTSATTPISAVAIGNNAQASANWSIAIGDGAKTYQGLGDTVLPTNYGVAIGNGATAIGNNIVMGNKADGTLLYAGEATGVRNINNVSIGNGAGAKLTGRDVVAIGQQAGTSSTGGNNIIIGKNAGSGLGAATNANGFVNSPVPSLAGNIPGSSSNIVIGDAAGTGMSASTGTNTFIGQYAGQNVSSNIARFDATLGYVDANGKQVNPAAAFAYGNNVGIGGVAGSNSVGEMNAAIGWKAGTFITGSGNSSFGILSGYKATGNNNLMMGSSFSGAYTIGNQNVALGNGSGGNVTGNNNSAIGNGSGTVVTGNNNVAVGNGAGQNVAGPAATPAAGNNNTAIGNQSGSNVNGSGNFAGGNNSGRYITGTENTSLGRGANLGTAAAPLIINRTVALGSASTTYSDDSIAIGTGAIAGTTTGNTNTIAIGTGAKATGLQSISVGTGNVVTGNYSGAFGDPSIIDGTSSYSVGNSNTIAAGQTDVFVLGNNVTKTISNSVALGSKAAMEGALTAQTGGLTAVTSGTVNGITYGTFAGATPVGVVSVGDVGAERRIQNVAAGQISATSTDAINGSQLYLTQQALGTVAATIGPQAVTYVNGGAAPVYNTVNAAGATYATSTNVEGAITNLNNYVNEGWTIQGNGTTANTVAPTNVVNFVNGQNTTAVVTKVDDGTTTVTFNALSAQGNVNNAQLPVVYTLADGTKVYVQPDGSFNTAADGSGTTVATTDVIASMNDGANNTTTPMVLNNVGAGDLSATSTQAVNGSQINTLGTSIANNLGGGSTFDPTTGTVTAPTYTVINGNPSTGATVDATNVGDALAAINTAVQQPITFAGDTGTDVTRQLGSTLNIKGGATTPLTTGNIGVVANGTDQLDVQLAKNLTGLESIEVGGTSITTNGVVINNGPSITTTGINAGNTVITNVAAGAVNATSTDAVNGSQLYQTNVNVTNAQNTANTALDTANKGINFGDGTTANNYKLGETINVKGDSNVTSTTTADGVQLALAKDLKVDSVDAGGTIVNNFGVTTIGGNVYGDKNFTLALGTTVNMGGNVITNVAAGTNATDAVNVSQLNQTVAAAKSEVKAGTNIANVTKETNADGSTVYTVNADGAKVSSGSTAVTVTAGAKDANNVTDYVVDVSQATKDSLANADSAMQNVVTQIDGVNVKTLTKNDNTANFVSGDNVVLSSDGAGGIKVSTAKNVTFDSVNAGGTLINNNGVTTSNGNVYGNNLTLQGGTVINMGGNQVTNVAAGTAPTDAVNVSQLTTAVAAAKTTVTAGDNMVVTPTTNADGSTNYEVATARDVNFDKVTVGTVTIDNTTNKITGLAPGEVSSTSTDAINGSQLHQTNTVINNLGNTTAQGMGGGSTYDPVTGNLTTVLNVGGNTYNNVNDALNGVVQVANGGWNISANGANASNVGPTESVDLRNTDGNIVVSKTADSNDVTFNLAKNITVDSVKAGNTTVNNDGLTIANGPSVTTAGINAGGKVITNVAAGVADTDAVNVSQLNKGLANAVTTANSYTDARVNQIQQDVWNLGGRVDELEDNMHAGVATAMALKQAPYVPGKTTYFAGAAAYKSQGAVGVSLRRTADNGRWSLEGGFSSNKDGTGVFVGVSGVLGGD